MLTSLDRDVCKFKQQSELLLLIIHAAKEPERWAKNTVIMRNGNLESVGGEVKPKEPPAFRILTPEQMSAYLRGEIKNFGDIGKVGKQPVYSPETKQRYSGMPGKEAGAMDKAISSAKVSIDAAKKSIMDAFDSIQASGREFAALWSETSITGMKNQIAATLAMMGSKAKQAFVDITKFFSDAVASFNKSDAGKRVKGFVRDSKKALSDVGKGFAESETGKNIAKATKPAREFAAKMKIEVGFMATVAMENIQDAPDATKGQVIAGVGAAMGVIQGFLNAMASKADSTQVSGEFANNVKADLIRMLNKLSSQMTVSKESDSGIPTDILKKMLRSIRNIDAGMQKQEATDILDNSIG